MKKIHITESQLDYIKKMLTEETDNVPAIMVQTRPGTSTAQEVDDAVKGVRDQGQNPENYNYVIPGKAVTENIDEYNKQDSDSEEYQDVYNYLQDLKISNDPKYIKIMGGMYGNQGEVNNIVDYLYNYFGGRIGKDYIMSAVYDFRNEESNNIESADEYDLVAESRKFTKRQIKEAKIRKLRKSCEKFTKRDLK